MFLDEIGELSPSVQAKLLRLLQEYEVRPMGSVKSHPADVRIIAATNRDLEEEVGKGRFLEALECLERHGWHGNVRELENVIRRALVLGTKDEIAPSDLPPDICEGVETTDGAVLCP